MSCYDCVRKDYCTYIRYFNHDKMVDCIDFQDRDHTTHLANTLNEEIDCKYDLATTRYIRSNKKYLSNDVKSIVYKDKEYDIKILKAFDIIKEKKVDVGWFIECLSCGKPLEVYNDRYDKIRSCDGKDYHFMQLTQEQFDLLKETLL